MDIQPGRHENRARDQLLHLFLRRRRGIAREKGRCDAAPHTVTHQVQRDRVFSPPLVQSRTRQSQHTRDIPELIRPRRPAMRRRTVRRLVPGSTKAQLVKARYLDTSIRKHAKDTRVPIAIVGKAMHKYHRSLRLRHLLRRWICGVPVLQIILRRAIATQVVPLLLRRAWMGYVNAHLKRLRHDPRQTPTRTTRRYGPPHT